MIIFNAIFYTVVEPFIDLIGVHKKTEREILNLFTITICLIVDMIILQVLLGANLVEVSDNKITATVFRGKYTDFTDEWYSNIGF